MNVRPAPPPLLPHLDPVPSEHAGRVRDCSLTGFAFLFFFFFFSLRKFVSCMPTLQVKESSLSLPKASFVLYCIVLNCLFIRIYFYDTCIYFRFIFSRSFFFPLIFLVLFFSFVFFFFFPGLLLSIVVLELFLYYQGCALCAEAPYAGDPYPERSPPNVGIPPPGAHTPPSARIASQMFGSDGRHLVHADL